MDVMKKTLQFGFGVLYLGAEKADALAKELKKHYGLDEQQAKAIAKDMLKQTAESHKQVKRLVREHLSDLVQETGLVTKEEFDALKKALGAAPTKKKSAAKKKPARKKSASKKR